MSDNFIDILFILMCSDITGESYFTEVKDLSHSSVLVVSKFFKLDSA